MGLGENHRLDRGLSYKVTFIKQLLVGTLEGKMRKLIFSIFMRASRLVSGKGLSLKFPLLGRVYSFLFHHLKPAQSIVLVDVRGIKMYADVRGAGLGPGSIHGNYEKGEVELFKKIIKEGMIVVDIGANIGYYTLIAAKLVGENGKVVAFEPEPGNYSLLVKNIEVNGYDNVIPVQKAVSNKLGTIKLFLHPTNVAAHRIYNSHDGRKSIEIETITLDEFFKAQIDRIDVIKMDIEGAEIAALQGMKEILKKNDDLKSFTEFSPEAIRTFGYSPENSLNELMRYGFKLFQINAQKGEITPIDIDTFMQMCSGVKATNLYISRH